MAAKPFREAAFKALAQRPCQVGGVGK
jgi:hypothetical protein